MATGKIIQADKIQGLADVPNFLTNPNGLLNTTGWTEGSYTAGARPTGNFTASSGTGAFTISRSTTNPLGVSGTSLLLSKSSGASRQGRAVVSDFSLPIDYRAKVLSIDINYIVVSGAFVAGSNTTDSSLIWYCAFSNDNGTTYTVAEPSSFKLLSNSTTISDRFRASIQTPYDATNMRLIAYVAETANSAWVVECIASVSPSEYVYGTPITDWQSYTPTWTVISGTNPSIGNGSIVGRYRRVGDSAEVNIQITSGTTTTYGSGTYLFGLPPGVVATSTAPNGLGVISIYKNTAPFNTNVGAIGLYSTTQLLASGTGTSNWSNTVPVTLDAATAGHVIKVNYSYSVLGWSSSVQMSDSADTRVVAAAYNNIATTSLAPTTVTQIKYTNRDYDTHGAYNPTTGEYTVPVSGLYSINAGLIVSGTNTGGSFLVVYKNGVSTDRRFGGSSGDVIMDGTVDIQANQGDKLTFYVYVTNSGISTTVPQGYNHIEIRRISGPQAIAATETIACRYSTSAGNSVGTSQTLITYATKSFDTHGAYNTSTGLFTAPAYGLYKVSCMAFTANVALATNNSFQGYIYKNGVLYSTLFVYNGNGATTNAVGNGDDIVELLAGETISIRALSSVATTLSTDARYNYITIERIG